MTYYMPDAETKFIADGSPITQSNIITESKNR